LALGCGEAKKETPPAAPPVTDPAPPAGDAPADPAP
jgi:hypothetical protein